MNIHTPKTGKAGHGQQSKNITVRVPVQLMSELQKLAAEYECTRSQLIITALKMMVEKHQSS